MRKRPSSAESVRDANLSISRGHDDKSEARKRRNARLTSPGVLPAAAGALISGEDEESETKEVLDRAVKRG